MNYPLIALLILTCVYGAAVELDPDKQALHLYIGLHLAGLGAIISVTISILIAIPSKGGRFLLMLLQLSAFRIAYFPVMVLSATVACYSEWLMLKIAPGLPVKIFPIFFLSAAIMFVLISELLIRSFKGEIVPAVLVVVISTPMLLISFSTLEDFTFLPDNNRFDITPLPEVTLPKRNPYLSEDVRGNVSQQLVAVAGSLLYPLIPDAPWSQAAKGTLEMAYRINPEGSSQDRLYDHYAAFLAAHHNVYGNLKNSNNISRASSLEFYE